MTTSRDKVDQLIKEINRVVDDVRDAYNDVRPLRSPNPKIVKQLEKQMSDLNNLEDALINIKTNLEKNNFSEALKLLQNANLNEYKNKKKEWMSPPGNLIRTDRIKIWHLAQEFDELKTKWKKELKELDKNYSKTLSSSKATLYSKDATQDLPSSDSNVSDILEGPDSVKLWKQWKEPLLGSDDSASSPSSKSSPTSHKKK